MNIQLNYLYRDAGNYKFYHQIIFSNNENIKLEAINEAIGKKLIDGEYFVPQKWNVPLIEMAFEYDDELDHDWYTFEGIEFTEKGATESKDIKNFFEEIK